MKTLLSAHNISKHFGTKRLFENISFTISSGERIGLIGPNGAGKSTLLSICMQVEEPDSGYISRCRHLTCAHARQLPEFTEESALSHMIKQDNLCGDPLDIEIRARILLDKAQFSNEEQPANTLSGGWKKRLDIARALMYNPDILFLDEPTNHLDFEGIIWLENFLSKLHTAYLIVSHDRYFLENTCTKIIDLNPIYPTGIFICNGTFSTYLETKKAFIEGQQSSLQSLKNIARAETAWLQTSPKARTCKSRSRMQKAYALLDDLQEMQARSMTKTVQIDFSASQRETKKLLSAKNLGKTLQNKQLFSGLDIVLSPGARLGITGENGTGKTTLLKILAGLVPQDVGTIKYAQDIQVAYFDQNRENISPDTTLKDALSPNSDLVTYRGQPIHVHGWAKRFLFSPEKLTLPVKYLSGGERARIHLAKLMLQPADILFLDEPTNDLDIPTLEIIEESLQNFEGAIVLITHDRCLMDRLCTEIIGLGVDLDQHHFATFSQWWERCTLQQKKTSSTSSQKPVPQKKTPPQTSSRKRSYKEQRELEGIEQVIIQLEQKIQTLEAQLASEHHAQLYQELANAQTELDNTFARWQELSDI